MNPDVIELMQVLGTVAAFLGCVTVFGISAFVVVRRQLHRPASRPDPLTEQRLHQLQQSVDAIALEVERISEAQRFTTRLLSDRGTDPAPLAGGSRL